MLFDVSVTIQIYSNNPVSWYCWREKTEVPATAERTGVQKNLWHTGDSFSAQATEGTGFLLPTDYALTMRQRETSGSRGSIAYGTCVFPVVVDYGRDYGRTGFFVPVCGLG